MYCAEPIALKFRARAHQGRSWHKVSGGLALERGMRVRLQLVGAAPERTLFIYANIIDDLVQVDGVRLQLVGVLGAAGGVTPAHADMTAPARAGHYAVIELWCEEDSEGEATRGTLDTTVMAMDEPAEYATHEQEADSGDTFHRLLLTFEQ